MIANIQCPKCKQIYGIEVAVAGTIEQKTHTCCGYTICVVGEVREVIDKKLDDIDFKK